MRNAETAINGAKRSLDEALASLVARARRIDPAHPRRELIARMITDLEAEIARVAAMTE
jgi:hypothetical protein